MILIILFVGVFNIVNAQTTTVISPTGAGGFELGTDFPSNGWTVVSPATQFWRVGTAAAGYTGTRGAYWGTALSNTYATGTSRTGHFYRDVTIPAGATNV